MPDLHRAENILTVVNEKKKKKKTVVQERIRVLFRYFGQQAVLLQGVAACCRDFT